MNLDGMRYAWQALSGRLGSEWERDRRDTLFLMGAIALAALPQAPFMPAWVSFAFAALFFWRLAILFSGRPLPGLWVRVLGAIGAVAAVLWQYQSLIGREQGVAMLVLFLGLKLMEMKARRDLFVVIALCFFLLLTTFFASQSIPTAMAVLVAVLALLASMITMQFGHREAAIGRRFRQATTILLQALPFAIVLFLLFPRLNTPLWGLQGSGDGGASTGLSSSMSPGSVTDLSQSSAVAFRVEFAGAVPPTRDLYWRGPVFGRFDGRTWDAVDAREGAGAGDRMRVPRIVKPASAEPLRYDITLEPTSHKWLLALEALSHVEPLAGVRTRLGPDLVLEMDRVLTQRIRYRAYSHPEYVLDPVESPQSLRPWLALPEGFNARTLALAARWRTEMPEADARAFVDRALALFNREPFRYTLQPPPLERDTVDEFLFDTRAGFCEHYASAFVVLMRALGVPARIVTGYQGGELNPVDGYWIVRQADAHAWAEVWLGERGWVRVDPTSAVAPERIENGTRLFAPATSYDGQDIVRSLWRSISLNLDAITNRWNQWVLQYDRTSQRGLLERLGLGGSDWYGLAGLLAGAMLLIVGAGALLTLKPRNPRDPVGALWEEFCLKLAIAGLPRLAHETPSQYLQRTGRMMDAESYQRARGIVGLYMRLRYGALSSGPIAADAASDEGIRRGQPRAMQMAEGLRELRRAVKAFRT